MDKNEMLKILLDDLKHKTDTHIIEAYKDAGIDVIKYEPGVIGEVKII
ncbi:MAG: hypothetical protein LKF87_10065 [Clostridium tyrobutyricum]|jgi:hypothetical protein|nr:hypothetical protein [Clostridium tyrobutyricum]MCH4201319.1 hypothetical protein [Clostridium tyrobutyricum]MCH4259294.1 hypothetical protein [Clostridium tyrobutyricum]